jgi:LmbE family N-acetylglucosaminyl deacetylase
MHVNYIVGDYWRTSPIALQINISKPNLAIAENCTTIRSSTGAPNLSIPKTSSFAYILSLDTNRPGLSNCSLEAIEKAFGEPSKGVIIAGTITNPKEVLLFYEASATNGKLKAAKKTLSPSLIAEFNGTAECQDKTIMAVVAHQDDDILFMNPDLNTKIQAGNCVRTVYLTAGDNGAGNSYWQQRRQGAEAAYNTMLGKPDQPWIEKNIQLPNKEYLTIANPSDDTRISLIFASVPDGKPGGEGFDNHAFQTLDGLWEGRTKQIKTVDGISSFDSEKLTDSIATIMKAYQPVEIWGQSSRPGTSDHSDHRATGLFTKKAYTLYSAEQKDSAQIAPLFTYIGYPIRSMPENVFDAERELKLATFMSYAQHDMTICRPSVPCENIGTYIAYISRQYREEPIVNNVSVRQTQCSSDLCRIIN